ncbi:MAG: hypothetical protein ACI94Y_001574 [Maribacter sp.]|jgi:hypothetical protein
MKYYLLSILILTISISLSAQSIWEDSNITLNRSNSKERVSQPSSFRTVSLDIPTFLNDIREVPKRSEAEAENSYIILSFPFPDGSMQRFRLVDAELMHPDLAEKFPQLRALIGKGIDDPTADIRINYSPYHGFNGMIKTGKHSTVYIDPLTKDHQHYMVYYRKDIERPDEGFQCHTVEADDERKRVSIDETSASRFGDCNLRRYRLAQSCTGEYAQYHIGQAGGSTGTNAGDKAIVQSAMNVTMNRVNGVYELDLGITMQFIANNDLIIYLNGNSDPWTNEWNTKTAQTIDSQIGVNNYDIGHNFNNTGGGNAGCLTCVCTSTSQSGTHKGRGYTGRSAPVGDPFDIDYVAHEMGHQFGGYHTQSNSSCRSGSGLTEVEPGSASTIMGYAGICSANVQNNSDDYFHYVNIRDIVDAINNGVEAGCAELIPSGNSSPTADAGDNYTIPVSTPFLLTGIATDPNDTGLTYCWEQNDPENHGNNNAPSPTRTVGPMFRSFLPVTVPYKYFPKLNDIINNNSPTWEVLPSVSRSMDFAFTVRDNNINSGCTQSDLMTVTTDASSGPFLVTAPNTGVNWDTGDTESITWDVAGTNNAPVNCANVDILLSTDGGLTYTVIASNIANDGAESMVVPNVSSTNNRIMIRCSDNIFFDISNQDFTINAAGPIVNFSSSAVESVTEGTSCNDKILSFQITMATAPNANTAVNLSLGGSALEGSDYDINASSFIFSTGNWNTPQDVILTIYEDGVVENSENIIVEIASVTGSDAMEGINALLHFSIIEDDEGPYTSGANIVNSLLTEDFEGAFPTGWSRTGSAETFLTGTAASLSSSSWTVPTSNATQILASNDDGCNCDMSNDVLESATFIVNSNMESVNALMNIYYRNLAYQGNTESAQLLLSKDGGTTFPISYGFNGATQWQSVNIDLSSNIPVSGSETWALRWVYNDNGGWLYGFAIDNIDIQFSSPDAAPVQTLTNTLSGYAEYNVGAGDIVHFYDQVTGDIMCTIDNSVSTHDYGCVRVEVDREGAGSEAFISVSTDSYLHSKTFKITPTNNTSSDAGGYTVSLYYTDAEVVGWENATSESKSNVYIHKADGDNRISDVSPGNPGAIPITSTAATYGTFGSNHTYSATFNNGFSGFGVGILSNPLLVMPKVFLEGAYSGTEMGDQLRVADLVPLEEPYTTAGYTHVIGGGEITTAPVLAVTDNDAIVDWVIVELRDAATPATVVATRAALIQKDGDVVDVDGVSAVSFRGMAVDNYYVAIRHRNHLGIMSMDAIALSSTAVMVDFTSPATMTYGTDARKDIGGVMCLHAGNVGGDGTVRATGPSFINDAAQIITRLGVYTTVVSSTYGVEDVNMDGTIRATGPSFINDSAKLINFLGIYTNVRTEQLP